MILDTGICSIFREADTAQTGGMPVHGYTLLMQSWYKELSFETSPARPTEGRVERRTDARIRVMEARTVKQNDIVLLEQVSAFSSRTTEPYRITRAFHGKDEDGPTPITDLSLEVYEP